MPHRLALTAPPRSLRPLPVLALAAALVGTAPVPAPAQTRMDPTAVLAAQAEAMRPLAAMHGRWRGTARTLSPDGGWRQITQTERMGPFLGGTVLVIEGRGYRDDGEVGFNAFGVVSFDPASRAYTLHSHAQGHVGDFAFEPTADGYRWSIPLGPAGTLRYVATIRDGVLTEIGERVVEGREPSRMFEMRLERIGDSDWPAAGAVPPR